VHGVVISLYRKEVVSERKWNSAEILVLVPKGSSEQAKILKGIFEFSEQETTSFVFFSSLRLFTAAFG